jgi:hypothetical protein
MSYTLPSSLLIAPGLRTIQFLFCFLPEHVPKGNEGRLGGGLRVSEILKVGRKPDPPAVPTLII